VRQPTLKKSSLSEKAKNNFEAIDGKGNENCKMER
jgi:hypothetical protein